MTGLGTLISGAYIGLEIGDSKEQKRDFVGLETQPVVTGEVPGRLFVLKTPDLGSLDTGTPVFFRRLQVGQVSSYALDQDGKLLTVKVFVRAPYDQYVNPNTRFWNASGVDVSLSASGLKVQTQSVLSNLIGGIAFETDPTLAVLPPAAADAVFTLFDDRAHAFEAAARNPQSYQLIFNQSVRGLTVGAPVEFRGIPVGEVTGIRAQIDLRTFQFSVPVTIQMDPQRLGVNMVDVRPGTDLEAVRKRLIDSMVAHGVRAQLQTGNLLTGAVYVAIDFFPGRRQRRLFGRRCRRGCRPYRGRSSRPKAKVENIIEKLDKMPLQQIGDNLQKALGDLDLTLVSARGTLVSAQGTLGNASNLTAPNSAQVQQLDSTLQEVSRAARSVRVLSDYLERHPEALLRGKSGATK